MEITLTAEQETQLSQMAARVGKGAEELASEVFRRGLAEEAQFLAAVELGRTVARRGDFVDQADVWAGVERALEG